MIIEPRRASGRLAAAWVATAIAMLHAQEAPPPPAYKYEVASIHRAAPGEANSGFSDGPQGGLWARNVTAMQALSFAYAAENYQFTGAPGWAHSERFEIRFTPDRTEIVPGPQTSHTAYDGWLGRQRLRMQAVLRDRFSLALRAETRELPIYVLTVAKGGHKLAAPAHPERGQNASVNGGQQIVGTNATMKALAGLVSMVLGRPVRDETGLDGAYDFKLDWAPDSTQALQGPVARPGEPAPASEPGRGSIFAALTEKLGLRLESKKGPVPVYVIEKIEKPSDN
jgi:uncharacterized protein (TIGR03435 family)